MEKPIMVEKQGKRIALHFLEHFLKHFFLLKSFVFQNILSFYLFFYLIFTLFGNEDGSFFPNKESENL